MLRLLHSADWHLGHHLHGLPRDEEHQAFLDWLLAQISEREIHALLISGDLFDTAHPSVASQAMFFRFLAAAREARPGLRVVAIGGNHDSPARLDAPHPLLQSLDLHVVGGLARGEDGGLDLERLLIPLRGSSGEVEGVVAAVPFLRAADLPALRGGATMAQAIQQVYAELAAAASALVGPRGARIALGHLPVTGAQLSRDSERAVLVGQSEPLGAEVFGQGWCYVGLGHLHLAQKVGGRDDLRYPGSPLPLSMAESSYHHQVLLAEVEEGELTRVRSLSVPRQVELLRLPEEGPAPVEAVVERLRRLPRRSGAPESQLPFLEVQVLLPSPRPGLRREVEQALEDRAARLVRIGVSTTGDRQRLGDALSGLDLREIAPVEVFLRRWRMDHSDEPPEAVLRAFQTLLAQAEGGA